MWKSLLQVAQKFGTFAVRTKIVVCRMLRDRRLSRIHLFSIRRILAPHHRGDAANKLAVSGRTPVCCVM